MAAAFAHQKRGQYAEALSLLEGARFDSEDLFEARYRKAHILGLLGERAKSNLEFEKLVGDIQSHLDGEEDSLIRARLWTLIGLSAFEIRYIEDANTAFDKAEQEEFVESRGANQVDGAAGWYSSNKNCGELLI